MKLNKKAYINDVVTGSAMLLSFFVVLGLCIFILLQFNEGVQASSAWTPEAKAAQQDFTNKYPTMMGWLFPATLIGLMLYTLITAYLIDVISRIWFIIGFVVAVIQSIVGFVIQQTFEEISKAALFDTALVFIPGAVLYFTNIILINSIWAFMILVVLYFKKEA